MPDSKIQLFGLLFPILALFLAPNHDTSPITIIILAIHSIANYNFSFTAHATGIFQNGGKLSAPFLRSVAIPAVRPVYIYIVDTMSLYFFKQIMYIKNIDCVALHVFFLLYLVKVDVFVGYSCKFHYTLFPFRRKIHILH